MASLKRDPFPHVELWQESNRVIRGPKEKTAQTARMELPNGFVSQTNKEPTSNAMLSGSRCFIERCRANHARFDTPGYVQTELRNPVALVRIPFLQH